MKQLGTVFSIRQFLFSGLALLIFLLAASVAFAQAETRVYPQRIEEKGRVLTVEVMAENVTNMYGAEFRVKYDPAVFAVRDAEPEQDGVQIAAGDLLPVDKGFVVANEVNEAEGTITYALTLLRPAEPVNGAGPLARIEFDVLQASPSTINVEHAKLVSIDPAEPSTLPQTIPSETAALSIGESEQQAIEEEAPAQSVASDIPAVNGESGFPWWIVAVGILILGLLALGGLVIMGGGVSKFQPVKAPARQANPSPSIPAPGSRPSAFKPRIPHADLSRDLPGPQQ